MDDERAPDPGTGRWRRRLSRVRAGEATTGEALALLGATLAAALGAWLLIVPVLALLWQVRQAMLDPAAIGTGGTPLRDAALILAAVLGAPFVIWRTITAHWQAQAARRQSEIAEGNRALTEDRNLTDRFIRAVEMLGAGTPEAPILEQRLGGIYALEKLAQESEKHHIQIMEVLCAYVRTNAPASKARTFPGTVLDRLLAANRAITDTEIEADPDFTEAMAGCGFTLAGLRGDRPTCFKFWTAVLSTPREDIRATLDAIGRRSDRQRQLEAERRYRLDLARTNLQRANLGRTNLERANLMGSHLEAVHLREAHLDGADFGEAHLEGVQIFEAHLAQANFRGAHLEAANLHGSHMERADLVKAHLARAFLWQAHLEGAKLVEADLSRANLGGARLEGANLARANLEWSYLVGTRLARANLAAVIADGAAAAGVDFSAAQIDAETDLRNTFLDASVNLPEAPYPKNRPVYRWPEGLNETEFHGRWRGWIEACPDPYRPQWTETPIFYADAAAIPPPPGVQWVNTESD